ncbi:MAG TPA: RNA-binding protein [Nitrosopumilaceae archaeon]|jgi:translin
MSLTDIKTSLSNISKELANLQDSREYLLKNTRDVLNLCSQSIISAHKGDLDVAKKKALKASKLLEAYRKKANSELKRYLVTPEQELVEASAFLAIVENKTIPSVASLKVSNESYVLGLMDLIGELKRYVFDNIRIGKSKEASRVFEIMENLYLYLYPFALYDKILKEARKKLDVNRRLIEDARSAITEEVRRTDLIDSFSKINRK